MSRVLEIARAFERRNSQTPSVHSSAAPQEQVEGIIIDDIDIFDCPICVEPLYSPVYQCENGHLACERCCSKMNKKCPSCRFPIYSRCRAMETVIESIKFSCKNMQYGCTAKVSHGMKLQHESTCYSYSPCLCPYPGCKYIGISSCLYNHCAAKHNSISMRYNSTLWITVSNNQNYVVMKELNEKTLFVLNHTVEPFGRLINVVCIAPAGSSKKVISYDLTAKVGDISLNIKSVVDVMPKRIEGSPARNFLVIPGYFSKGVIIVKLTLRTDLKS